MNMGNVTLFENMETEFGNSSFGTVGYNAENYIY